MIVLHYISLKYLRNNIGCNEAIFLHKRLVVLAASSYSRPGLQSARAVSVQWHKLSNYKHNHNKCQQKLNNDFTVYSPILTNFYYQDNFFCTKECKVDLEHVYTIDWFAVVNTFDADAKSDLFKSA